MLEEVLAARALTAPGSLTNIPRALDLLQSGPTMPQFLRYAYLNADGEPQRRDLRDSIAVTCIADGDSPLATFAAQSENARQAQADLQLVSIRADGRPRLRSSAEVGIHISRPGTCHQHDQCWHVAPQDCPAGQDVRRLRDSTVRPIGRLESICGLVMVHQMTEPIGVEHTVPPASRQHPSKASRPASVVPLPQRTPTTRSMLLDAGVDIVNENGLWCALPSFTVGDLLERLSSDVTEGAFHHSWPRKVDFEHDLIAELANPDTDRYLMASSGLQRASVDSNLSASQVLQVVAGEVVSRPVDPTFMYVATLVASGDVSESVTDSLRMNFERRAEVLEVTLNQVATRTGRKPVGGLGWEQITWMAMAITDGMQLRLMCDPAANEPSVERLDNTCQATVLGECYEALFNYVTEPC